MKKFVKILSNIALASLIVGGTVSVASCGNKNDDNTKTTESHTKGDSTTTNTANDQETAESLAALINTSVNGTKVSDNFKLPAYVGSGESKKLITWVSDNESLLTFTHEENAETYTAVVHRPAADNTDEYSKVTFHGVVTVNEAKASTSNFNVRIRREVTAQELYEEWISNTGVTQTVSGYVIAKLGYISKYKEANLILWNPEVSGSYYVYNGYIDEDVYKNLALGTYVTAKGATNTIYNGLLETKYGATFTVDSSKTIELSKVTRSDITKKILDSDLVTDKGAATTEALKLQSTYVSLSGFEIKEIKTYSSTSGSNATTAQTIATLTRGGIDIDVIIYEGATPFAEASTKAISDKLTSIGEGKRVKINAILSWYNEPQLLVTSADDIVACEDGYTDNYADYDLSYAAANEAIRDLKANYNTTTSVTLPTTYADASIEYEVSGDALSYDETTHVLTITALKEAKTGKIKVTATSGLIIYETEVEITAQSMSDEEIVNSVLTDITIDAVSAPKVIELASKAYNDTVTLAYEVVDGTDVASIDKDGKLVIIPATEAKTVKIKVTGTLGEISKDKTVEVSVAALPVTSIADVLAATYDSNNKAYYCVEGYITNIYNTSDGNGYIDVEFGSQKKKLCIYKSHDIYGNRYGKIESTSPYYYKLGKKVKVYGFLSQYNKVNQLQDVTILSVESDPEIDALVAVKEAAELFESSYAKAATVTLPEGITAVTTASSVSVSGQVVTITPADAEEKVTITLSKDYNGTAKTTTVEFTTKYVNVTRYTDDQIKDVKSVTAAYTGTTSTNAKADGSINDYLGITDTNITISGYKNDAGTITGFNKDGSTRLYADSSKQNGGSIEISVANGYAIKSITFTFTSSSKTPVLSLEDKTVITAKDKVYSIGANKVIIQNKDTGQVQIKSIVIEYGSVNAE